MKNFLTSLLHNRLVWISAAVALAGLGYWLIIADGAASRSTFVTAELGRGDIQMSVSSSGAVAPLITVTVGAQVSGQLTEINVDFNTEVKKDQLLAVVEPSTFQAKLRSAQADLLVQQATIGSNDVQVSNAKVNLAQAQRDYDRTKSLADQGLLSTNDLEKARNALEQMQNGLKIAQATLNNSKALLVRVQAQLEQARIDLSHTQIRSPVDGVVIERDVDVGQTVQSSMTAPTLFKIARDLSQIQIETKVDEADIGSVQQAKDATFTVDAYPGRQFTGHVAQVRINGAATSNVVTYSVMVQADNPGQILLPGMTANVKLVIADRRNVLRLPNAALRFHPGASGGSAVPGGARPQGNPPGGGTQRALVELTPEVMQQLGLDAKQQAAAAAALKGVAERIRAAAQTTASNPLGGGMPNFRRMFGNQSDESTANRQRTLNALGAVMTQAQLQQYQSMSAAVTERNATVYLPDSSGKPVAHSVRVGLGDDNYTEVISGLAAGDTVIVRAKAAPQG